jgi:hypothetical protein
MTVEGRIFHAVELMLQLDADCTAFFTVDRIAQITSSISPKATMVEVLQELLRVYLEYRGVLNKEIELSGLLGSKIIYTGKLGDKIIYFNGSIL